MECPFCEAGYDSQKKEIYLGEYSNKIGTINYKRRILGKYIVFEATYRTKLTDRRYVSEEMIFMFVADTQTHEVGMVNPVKMQQGNHDIKKELEDNQ